MLRYKLKYSSLDGTFVEKIQYKCLICGLVIDWDDTWTDEKKAQAKEEAVAHNDFHTVPQDII
jgi:hypothetical protein